MTGPVGDDLSAAAQRLQKSVQGSNIRELFQNRELSL